MGAYPDCKRQRGCPKSHFGAAPTSLYWIVRWMSPGWPVRETMSGQPATVGSLARLCAMHSSSHSTVTFSIPQMMNRLKDQLPFRRPNTLSGSTMRRELSRTPFPEHRFAFALALSYRNRKLTRIWRLPFAFVHCGRSSHALQASDP